MGHLAFDEKSIFLPPILYKHPKNEKHTYLKITLVILYYYPIIIKCLFTKFTYELFHIFIAIFTCYSKM